MHFREQGLRIVAMKIGVLDIQGSVAEHCEMLGRIDDVEVVRVKKVEDLDGLAGLILPGGESTTMGKLLSWYGLGDAICKKVESGEMALWGTCAGAILMAKEIMGDQRVQGLKLMDIVVERNAYGRQVDSFECELDFEGAGKVPAVFIRAPKITRVGEGVEILARHNGEIVAARQGKMLVTSFHPEMSSDERVHLAFVGMSHYR